MLFDGESRWRDGDVLAEEQAAANGKEQVAGALGQATTKLRKKLGKSLASVQKYDAPRGEGDDFFD